MGLVLLKEEIEMAHQRQVDVEKFGEGDRVIPEERDVHQESKMEDTVLNVSKPNQDLDCKNNVSNETFVDWLQLTSEIYQSAQAAVAVLSDLLNYDKIETGTLHLELSLVSLWTLLEQTANEFKVAAGK
jgi:signal transduction histidine kinase